MRHTRPWVHRFGFVESYRRIVLGLPKVLSVLQDAPFPGFTVIASRARPLDRGPTKQRGPLEGFPKLNSAGNGVF